MSSWEERKETQKITWQVLSTHTAIFSCNTAGNPSRVCRDPPSMLRPAHAINQKSTPKLLTTPRHTMWRALVWNQRPHAWPGW